MVGRVQFAVKGHCRSGLARRNIAVGGNAKQAVYQCANGVLALADTKIKVETLMTGKPQFFSIGLKFTDQPCFPHSRLAAHQHRLAHACFPARLECAIKLGGFGPPANQRGLRPCRPIRTHGQCPPRNHGFFKSLDRCLA